jgi:hypothetical protein
MQEQDESDSRNLTPDRIRFEFQWTEIGLAVLLTPHSFENYPLPYFLQQSLYPHLSSRSNPTEVRISKEKIPFGFIANVQREAKWGRLNINFEPCPDAKLRIYLSISEVNFPCTSDDFLAILLHKGKVMARRSFLRWTLECPPLPPGEYSLVLKHSERLLAEIGLTLHGTTDPPQRAAD